MTAANEVFLDQVILVDKPLEWTSFDVVKKLRYLFKIKKIGHAGTLDPLATGLLILCTGKKTKTIDDIQAQRKEYTGNIHLGYTTPSYDLETKPENERDISHITQEDLIKAANHFTGKQLQTPPIFSAVKKEGKRAYELARAGVEVELKSREIEIYNFEITNFSLPEISFKISCTKGTYIRSIAHDFGQYLGVGAYLSELRRTKIGEYDVNDSWQIDALIEHVNSLNKS